MPELLLLFFVISVFFLAALKIVFIFSGENLATGPGLLFVLITTRKWEFYAYLAGQCSFKWLSRGRHLFLLGVLPEVKNLRIFRRRIPP
jgi:hypothetical protein